MKKILYAIIAVFVLALTVGMVKATPSVVAGNVTLMDHVTPVDGASVSVTCQHLGSNTTLSTTSISDGTYFVLFNTGTCDFNDLLWVTANKNTMSGMNTGQMCNGEECFIPVAVVDVSIPEFGLLGAMIVVIAGVGIVAYKRKN